MIYYATMDVIFRFISSGISRRLGFVFAFCLYLLQWSVCVGYN